MYGSPDFIVESRLLLFCDGSFWHGRDWKKLKARLAAGNDPNYWVRHIDSNRKRGSEGQPYLEGTGAPCPAPVGHRREEEAGAVRGED